MPILLVDGCVLSYKTFETLWEVQKRSFSSKYDFLMCSFNMLFLIFLALSFLQNFTN